MFKRPIVIGLSPNAEAEDVWQAVAMMVQPWKWRTGASIRIVEAWFEQQFAVAEAVSFNSGRSALYAVLRAFEIGKEDEVIVQAFTCVAVPDAVLWTGAQPVFADIDGTLNIDVKLLEQRITKKTKAIIVQHTFGISADVEMITKIAQKKKILVIEDCSHSLGAEYRGNKIGSFGDAAIFSFGRDKIISSVFGGMAIINEKFKIKNEKLRNYHKQLHYPSLFWIFRQLLHPIIFFVVLPLYQSGIGKLLLVLFQKLGLLSMPIYPEEKRGGRPDIFPTKYPNALAALLLPQLSKLDRYNTRRKEIADLYRTSFKRNESVNIQEDRDGAIYLRFTILTEKSGEILETAKKEGMLLGTWYRNVIDPSGVEMKSIGYCAGSCPKAETAATLVVNLPTYPRLKDEEVQRVIDVVRSIVGAGILPPIKA